MIGRREAVILEGVYENDGRMDERPGQPSGEAQRVARDYRRYAASRRKRRSWSAQNPGNAAIRAELVSAVFVAAGDEIAAAAEILDIGCGAGWWLEQVSARSRAKLHGLELLAERAEASAERVPGAEIATGDARELPYEDGRFGVVTLFTVLSSMSGPEAVETALREARRVLAPGGVVLIWEPRMVNPLNPATALVGRRALRVPLAGLAVAFQTTTVAPMVARRLGRLTPSLYPRLAAVAVLRTHRLVCARSPRM
jgi:ubiquinone/menaquinone biosynthesis C-methylase UbiE